MQDIDLVISCGDLSYMYLEFIISQLNKPLLFVHGNHDPLEELNEGEPRSYPYGGENLHRRIRRKGKLLIGGVEGSILYNHKTPYQYTQTRMWEHVFSLVPGMIANKIRFGRFLDIFVTHAPPSGVHEGSDFTHQGIKAFRWLINTFRPAYHFHGHVHVYRPGEIMETRIGNTLIVNTFNYRITEVPAE